MVDMKVSEQERDFLIFTRMLRATMAARKWVYWLAVRFGTEVHVNTGKRKLKARQFFGEQYLVK